ncbi:MAG: hypothetical protein WDZ31_02200 [Phycisphaeraceae bacterium]
MGTTVYELKCPSCGQVVRSSFVRVGSVTDCTGCGHRYRIHASQVARKAPAAAAGGAGQPLVPEAKELVTMAGARVHLDEAGNVIGLSGLSDMMRQDEPGDGATTDSARSAGSAPLEDSPPALARPVTRRAAPPRRIGEPRSLYMIASAFCLGITVVGVSLWYASTQQPDDRAAGQTTPESDLPVIMAIRLTHEPWDRPDVPFDRSDPRSAPDHAVRLTDTNLRFPANGQPVLTASVTSDRAEVIALARVHISLVDQEGVEVARTRTDAALIGRGHRHRLRLPLPGDLAGQWLGLESHVELLDRWPDGQFLDGALAVPLGSGGGRNLRLMAANTSDVPMRRMVFLVTALDEQDLPISRWRATWNQPVAPGRPVECQLITPMSPETRVSRWHVEVAGQPMPAPPAEAATDPDAASPVPPGDTIAAGQEEENEER